MAADKTPAARAVCNGGGAAFATRFAATASETGGSTGSSSRLRRAAISAATPQQLEEARPHGATSRIKRFRDCTYDTLLAMLGVTVAILVMGLFAIKLHHRTLGRALICTGFAIETVVWVIFLCTLAERPRALLASLFAPPPCNDDASKALAERRARPDVRPPVAASGKLSLPV
ncbi:uncharacterized protein LOC144123557 [Amblyomma americanum]